MADRKKVLIIDDEIDLCLLLKSYLLRKNYDVYLSHTLGEGISFLKNLEPDLIFIDNNLPDGTGWSVAPKLAEEHPNMHINLISAFHPVSPDMPPGSSFTIFEKPISLTDLDKQLVGLQSKPI
jgi:DNA-binding NtrC family response regulator